MNNKEIRNLMNDTMHRTFTNTTLTPSALNNLRKYAAGFPTQNDGGGATLNEDGTPAGLDKYLNDPTVADRRAIERIVQRMHADSIRLNVLLTEWTTTANNEPETNGNDCEACGVHITKPERLRAGLCNACRMSWQRWSQRNKGERHEWLWQRRRATAQQPDDVGTSGTQETPTK